jgi:uncharacterized membrane protein YsdA (DUF1294 family)
VEKITHAEKLRTRKKITHVEKNYARGKKLRTRKNYARGKKLRTRKKEMSMSTKLWIVGILALGLTGLNVLATACYAFDKYSAIKKHQRISEAVLIRLMITAPFGSVAGMLMTRHKTRKLKFVLIGTLSAAIHLALYLTVLRMFG